MTIVKNQKIEEAAILISVLVLVSSGVYFRLVDIGKWGFATDEFYMATSINNIISHGVPIFSNGGLYMRGILFQYFEAFLSLLFPFNEGTLRYGSVIFNLLTFPGLYLLGKRLGGKYVGLSAVGIFGISLWEIEFSRFIRMYTILQCLFVWYVYFLVKAIVDQEQSSLKWLYLIACLSVFVHESAIIVVVLLFLPLLFEFQGDKKKHFVISSIILFFAYYYISFDFRFFGNKSHLPSDFQAIEHGSKFILPKLYFLNGILEAQWWFFSFMLIVGLNVYFNIKLWKDGGIKIPSKVIFSIIMLLSLMQMYGAGLVILVMSLVLEKFKIKELSNRSIKKVAGCIGVNFGFWLLYGLFNDSWIKSFENLPEISIKKVLVVLLKWPNVFDTVIYPYLNASPVIFTYIIGSFLYLLYILNFKLDNRQYPLRVVVIITIISICVLGLISTKYNSTRYSFFLYPIFILLLVYTIKHILNKLKRFKHSPLIYFSSTMLIFTASDDFNFHHLAKISSPEINFRMDFDEDRKRHFYQRVDFKSPSEFINNNVGSGDIVISTLRPPYYYLNNLDYVFLSSKSGEFRGSSITGGKREFWTSSHLIYKFEDLINIINNSPGNVWLIEYSEKYEWKNDDERNISQIYSKYEVYRSIDGTVRVLKIGKI